MGGAIAITIRDPDGREHRMCRWTNPTPHFINNLKLFEKDREYLKEYLDTWYGFRRDYADHKHDGNFEHGMTKNYAPYPYLAPEEYGLIVIDMINNVILHAQDYANIGSIFPVTLLNSPEDMTRLEALAKAGRIVEVGQWEIPKPDAAIPKPTREDAKLSMYPAADLAWRQIKRKATSRKFYLDASGFFVLDTKPFQVIDYRKAEADRLSLRPGEGDKFERHSKAVGQVFRAKLLELGFEISGKEKKIWKEYYTDRDDGDD